MKKLCLCETEVCHQRSKWLVPKSVPPIGIGALGHPTFPNAIKTQNVIAPNTTFHPDKVLAENFHFEITHPDSNNPKALGAVPIPPENPKMFQNVVWAMGKMI